MNQVPTQGFYLPLWNDHAVNYRATAIAYLQRENLTEVKHTNGSYYTLTDLKNALVTFNKN